jgi:polysaccharide deacetylase family protein (PEP-CTERM system associated)
MLNALTIDVEDWYHPELVRHHLSDEQRESHIVEPTQMLLSLLRDRQVKATFFVVGEVVRRHPRLIEAIVAQGHELGCHGMSHRPLWDLTPDDFRRELQEFSATVEELVPGAKPVGFRAPTFSLDNRTRWALGILNESGYGYDSSVFPARMPIYGVSGCPTAPYRPSAEDVAIADENGPLVEFPMSVWSWAGLRVPVCGGFYLRALPFGFVSFCLRQINESRPFVIYVHPWEMYRGTPRLPLPLVTRFITYYNMDKMASRLCELVDRFRFAPMKSVLGEMGELNL